MKKAKLNFVDKAIAFINPKGAVDRLIARQKLTKFEYDAVKYTRERRGPSALSGAEDYRSNYDRVELMKRARDLAENVGLVRSLLLKFAGHVAGSISYQARTQNPQINTDVEAYWAEWWDKCDISTRHTGSTLMQVAVMSMLRDGDFLFVLVRDGDGNLKIQGIEADRLGDPFKVYTSLELVGGIHIDRSTGAPTAYDIYNRSIGDFYTYQLTIPSSQAFHLFDPLRIDQYRGISAFHTAINDATDIYDIINYEKMAAKVASAQSGIVKRNNNNAADLSTLANDEDLSGNTIKLETIESGKISYLEPGEDIIFPNGPSRPSGAFAEFHKILLRNICLGLGIPYSFAVDPSQMSGPTARLEMQQAGRTFRRYQNLLNDKVLRPIKNIVLADAVARGLISGTEGGRTTKGIFNFGANVSIDLGRESASAISEFKTGLRTAADIYAERGQDFESAMRQRAIEAKLIKDLAEKYQIDPQTISDVVPPAKPEPQMPKAPAPQPPISQEPPEDDDGEDESGEEPEPDEPLEPSSENLEVKKKEAELEDCGTGAGGFKPGNTCAGGGVGESASSTIDRISKTNKISDELKSEIKSRIEIMEDSVESDEKSQKEIKTKEWQNQALKTALDDFDNLGEDAGGQFAGISKSSTEEEKREYAKWNKLRNEALRLKESINFQYSEFNDCGTGAGGFKEGNTCASGGEQEGASRASVGPKLKEVLTSERGDRFTKFIWHNLNEDGKKQYADAYEKTATAYEKTREELLRSGGFRAYAERNPTGTTEERLKKYHTERFNAIKKSVDPKLTPDQYNKINSKLEQSGGTLYDEVDLFVSQYAKNNKIPNTEDTKYWKKYQKDKIIPPGKVPDTLSSLNDKEIKMLIAGMMGGIELGKYDGIDFTPPEGAREAAKRALDIREKKPASQKGMTAVGIARARDLINGVKFSPDTIRRMKAFFDRHEVDKKGATWDEQGKGWQAWNGWGGDAGYAWARKVVRQMESRDKELSQKPKDIIEFIAGRDCGQNEDGTFGANNECAKGHGRPEGATGSKADNGKEKKAIQASKERKRIMSKLVDGGASSVGLPIDQGTVQSIERSYDLLRSKGYKIPPPSRISNEEIPENLGGTLAQARSYYNENNELVGQEIVFNKKYDEDGISRMAKDAARINHISTDDVFSHEYGHILHAKNIGFSDAEMFRKEKFGPGPSGEKRKEIAGQVSKYAKENPMEFVAETFAGHINGKRYSNAVYDMYGMYGGPELK